MVVMKNGVLKNSVSWVDKLIKRFYKKMLIFIGAIFLLIIFGTLFVAALPLIDPSINGHEDIWIDIQNLKDAVAALGGGYATDLAFANSKDSHGDVLAEIIDLESKLDDLGLGGIDSSLLVPIYEEFYITFITDYPFQEDIEIRRYGPDFGGEIAFYAFDTEIQGTVPIYEYAIHLAEGVNVGDVAGYYYSMSNNPVNPSPVNPIQFDAVNSGVAFYAYPHSPLMVGQNGSTIIQSYTMDPWRIGWKYSNNSVSIEMGRDSNLWRTFHQNFNAFHTAWG
jgi:hypothetical protein